MMNKKWVSTDLMLRVENKSIEEFAMIINIKTFFNKSTFINDEFDSSYFNLKEPHFNYEKYANYENKNKESFEYYIELSIYTYSYEDLIPIFVQASRGGFTIVIPDEKGSPLEYLLFEDGKVFKVIENNNESNCSFELGLITKK